MLTVPFDPNDTGKRVIDVISKQYPLSRRMKRWLRFHSVLKVNGTICRPQDLIRETSGEITIEIPVCWSNPDRQPFLQTAWEDEHLLVVFKPAGLPVHAASGRPEDSLCRRIMESLAMDTAYPVGRLDRDVSGWMLFAKNPLIASLLTIQRTEGKLHKTYLAVCHGSWNRQSGSIDAPIAHADQYNRYCVSPAGLPALTHYEVLKNSRDMSLVRIWIETGRTHQIRVHLQSSGHPIAGDPYYGICDPVHPLQLFACQLQFEHPITGEEIKVEYNPVSTDIFS